MAPLDCIYVTCSSGNNNNNKRLLRLQNRVIGETDGAVSPNIAIMRDLLYQTSLPSKYNKICYSSALRAR